MESIYFKQIIAIKNDCWRENVRCFEFSYRIQYSTDRFPSLRNTKSRVCFPQHTYAQSLKHFILEKFLIRLQRIGSCCFKRIDSELLINLKFIGRKEGRICSIYLSVIILTQRRRDSCKLRNIFKCTVLVLFTFNVSAIFSHIFAITSVSTHL